jgi:hypothetical protein
MQAHGMGSGAKLTSYECVWAMIYDQQSPIQSLDARIFHLQEGDGKRPGNHKGTCGGTSKVVALPYILPARVKSLHRVLLDECAASRIIAAHAAIVKETPRTIPTTALFFRDGRETRREGRRARRCASTKGDRTRTDGVYTSTTQARRRVPCRTSRA